MTLLGRIRGDQGGYSLTELVVAMMAGAVVMAMIVGLISVVLVGNKRVTSRVAANQRARPTMDHVIDRLHSSCVTPNATPVQAGSSGSQLRLISQTGSDVAPTPDLHVITLSGTTLSEATYPATGGTPPAWTFSPTPSRNRQLLTQVKTTTSGSPATAVPVFRYYRFNGSQISTTPLPTPLSSANALLTVKVDVAFETGPVANGARDDNAGISLSDTAILRTTSAGEDSGVVNRPCS